MNDRIACINPNCRRTAAQDKHPGSSWVICRKCWNTFPGRTRTRWKQLNARWRKVERTMRKRKTGPVVWNRVVNRLEGAWDRLNHDITHYFTTSEQPVGLEDFMKENGLV